MRRNFAKYLRGIAGEFSRFSRVRGGATAVEFALIAPAFLATMIAILQTCVFLYAQMALQNAANQAGRLFMTGQAQNNNWSASAIATQVCPAALFDCTNNLIVVVQNYSSFAAANTSAPQLYNGTQPVTTFTYNPGTPGEVMVVQLVYKWSLVSGLLGFTLSNLPNGAAEMMGVSAFRVEPY